MSLSLANVISKYEERLQRASDEDLEGTYAETLITLTKLREIELAIP